MTVSPVADGPTAEPREVDVDAHGCGALEAQVSVSVVVCSYTEARWELTRAALQSVLAQEPPPKQVLLVIDHNDALAQRARREYPELTVVENTDERGVSGARNTGLREASGEVTVFLDDDAVARPGWLSALVSPYRDDDVVATGGGVHPIWPSSPPRWLCPEFYWVVGCSYRGLPETTGRIRNPIGANMSMRTSTAIEAGGFYTSVGRVGIMPRGCEETELSIRLTVRNAGSSILYVPCASVDHHVSPERIRVSYFVRRNWHEGKSKATVVSLAGSAEGLRQERRHVTRILPAALLRDCRNLLRGDASAVPRSVATVVGVTAAVAGYVCGRLTSALHGTKGRRRTNARN